MKKLAFRFLWVALANVAGTILASVVLRMF